MAGIVPSGSGKSHCTTPDRYGHGGGTVNVANTIQDPNNINYDKGDCTWDRRHIFNSTVVIGRMAPKR